MRHWKKYIRVIALIAVGWLLISTLRNLSQNAQPPSNSSSASGPDSLLDSESGISIPNITSPYRKPLSKALIELPLSYSSDTPVGEATCSTRYGQRYLNNLRRRRRSYCHPKTSISSLECYGIDITGSRLDTFCVAGNAILNAQFGAIELDCDVEALEEEDKIHRVEQNMPSLSKLPTYWYETGPKAILDSNFNIDKFNPTRWTLDGGKCGSQSYAGKGTEFTILIKREGSGNTWHSLMEIFSMMLTMDAMQISAPSDLAHDAMSGAAGQVMFHAGSIENTQVIIVDELDDGPYFDLWSLFSGKPIIRLSSDPSSKSSSSSDDDDDESDEAPPIPLSCLKNVILPLPGAANPLWHSDWDTSYCTSSTLLNTFTTRLLTHYNLPPPSTTTRNETQPLTITFINRASNRRLLHTKEHLYALHRLYPHLHINNIDLAELPFHDQIALIRSTDILIGVHGAGLTHTLFLPPWSTVIEILPHSLHHKGFSNLAKLMGITYLSLQSPTHETDAQKYIDIHVASRDAEGSELLRPWFDEDDEKEGDEGENVWFWRDVSVERWRFLETVEEAMRTVLKREEIPVHIVKGVLG